MKTDGVIPLIRGLWKMGRLLQFIKDLEVLIQN